MSDVHNVLLALAMIVARATPSRVVLDRLVPILLVAGLAACGGGGVTTTRTYPSGGRPLDWTLQALDGGEFNVATLRGRIVVLHVFTTWSLAAQGEVESLIDADQLDDVVVVGLALDADGRIMVAPWRKASEVHYLVALADDRIRSGHSPLGPLSTVPTTIVLDRSGRLHGRADRQLSGPELTAMIAAARAAP